MAGIDFSNKTIELGDFFSPSGNVEKDLNLFKSTFQISQGSVLSCHSLLIIFI